MNSERIYNVCMCFILVHLLYHIFLLCTVNCSVTVHILCIEVYTLLKNCIHKNILRKHHYVLKDIYYAHDNSI